MLSQMREKNFIKWTLWAVVVSFVVTMVFVWGADYQGIGCSDQQAPQGQRWVAMVGDRGVSIQEFDQRLRQAYSDLAASRQPGQPITADESQRMQDQVFDQMINETLFQLEVERLGLEPTDAEVQDVLNNNPPEFLRRQFVDETGSFNMAAYKQALADPRINWVPIEEIVRQSLPMGRLQQIFASQIHISEEELFEEWQIRNTKVNLIYAGQAWRDAGSPASDPGDEALRAFYESRPDDFKGPAEYAIKVVEFNRGPSASDEAFVKERIQFVRDELNKGASFEDLARDYSEDLSNADSGGDLGWFGKGRMVPEFEQAAFALSKGQVSGPVRSQFGFHLIKKEDERQGADGPEIHTRHILLRVEPSYATLDSLNTLADSLSNLATELKSLSEAGTRMGLEVKSPPSFALNSSIEGLGFNAAIHSEVERLQPGQVSRRFTGRQADYVIQLESMKPEGLLSFDRARETALRLWKTEERKKAARAKVESLNKRVAGGLSLGDAAKAAGLEAVQKEVSLKDYLPGIGAESAFQLVAFRLKPGQVSGVIETDQGYWMLQVLSRAEPDRQEYPAQRPALLMEVLTQAQNEQFAAWVEELKNEYAVKDWREQFYN